MLNPLKMLSDLKNLPQNAGMMKQMYDIQRELAAQEIEMIVGDVRVVMTANQEVIKIEMAGVANEDLRRAINEAIKKSQKVAAEKMTAVTKAMGM